MELIIHGRMLLTRSLNRRRLSYTTDAQRHLWSYIGLAEYPLATIG